VALLMIRSVSFRQHRSHDHEWPGGGVAPVTL